MSKERGFPEIGKRILSIRAEKDQRAFSRLVNMSQQAISNYERGNLPASWGFLRRMLEDFNVSVNWILTGQGQRDYRAGIAYAALTDNRPPGWPRILVEGIAFSETETPELLLSFYFLCLATEPTDAKARLVSDFQAIVQAARVNVEAAGGSEESRKILTDVYDALAHDDRRSAISSLIQLGERLESVERKKALPRARKLYLSALGLAQLQGWPEEEVESARRVGRSYRKEGRWDEAERYFRLAITAFEEGKALGKDAGEMELVHPAVSPAVCARTLLGYGHVAREQGQILFARERYLAALQWAMQSQEAALRAEVYLDLACLAYREKDWQKALDFVGSGRAFAEQAVDSVLLNQFKLANAVILRERGEQETAEAILRALQAQTEKEADLATLVLVSVNLAEVLIDRGKTDEAEDLLQRTAPLAQAQASPRNLALRKLLQARLEAAKGEERAARAMLFDCMRYARDQGLTAEFEQAADTLARFEEILQIPPAVAAG